MGVREGLDHSCLEFGVSSSAVQPMDPSPNATRCERVRPWRGPIARHMTWSGGARSGPVGAACSRFSKACAHGGHCRTRVLRGGGGRIVTRADGAVAGVYRALGIEAGQRSVAAGRGTPGGALRSIGRRAGFDSASGGARGPALGRPDRDLGARASAARPSAARTNATRRELSGTLPRSDRRANDTTRRVQRRLRSTATRFQVRGRPSAPKG